MKLSISIIFFLLISYTVLSQSEEEYIKNTIQAYLDGSSHSDPELIMSAFYENADLFLSKKDEELWILSPESYSDLFKQREKGKFNGRHGKILAIDQANTIATAKAEIRIPSRNLVFIDLFLLKKIEGQWKIISKAATSISE